MSWKTASIVAVSCVVAPLAQSDGSEYYISMGSGDLLLGQPTVGIEVYTPDNPSTSSNEFLSYGPELIMDTLSHTFLLDTGANGLMLGRDPYADTVGQSNLEQMQAKGFDAKAGIYVEQGVGGFETNHVSGAYNLDYATSEGSSGTIRQARFMCNDRRTLADYSGLIGMPAMTNRVVVLDMSPWLESGLSYMQTRFTNRVESYGNPRYHVDLEMKEFARDGWQSGTLPSWAPLPFVRARVVAGMQFATGDFLMDTGAQMSILSEHLAFQIGLDDNQDGVLNSNDTRYVGSQQIMGVGSPITIPTFLVGWLAISTQEGGDLRWESLTMAVLEISPRIDGVVGMDLMHSGWTDGALGGTSSGAIQRVFYDFRNCGSLTGEMVLDLSPSWDLSHASDSDGDGLPDFWEQAVFGGLSDPCGSPSADCDGDGISTESEFKTGSDPRDPESRFAITYFGKGADDERAVLAWQGAADRSYAICSKGCLTEDGWSTNRSDIAGVYPETASTVRLENAASFIKIVLEE